jgi:lysophospholipase L1-like esterase
MPVPPGGGRAAGPPIHFRWWVWTLALTVSCLGAFIVGEVVLRLLGVSFPLFWRPDEQLGFVLQPGDAGWWRSEGEAYITINHDGMRDRERTRAKPADTVRVALLGDSTAEALQVPLEQTFAAVVEREFGRNGWFAPKKVEVLNFGVSGYGTAQQYLQLQQRVWAFEPDIVLLAFTTGNDIRNNSKVLEWDRMRPFFELKHDDLVLDNSFRDAESYRRRRSPFMRYVYEAINGSRVLQLVREGRNSWTRRRLAAEQAHEVAATGRKVFAPDELVYREPPEGEWATAWRVTERLLLKMRDEATLHRARFFVVITTNDVQVIPDRRQREAWMAKRGLNDLSYPNRRLVAFCAGTGIPALDLLEPLRRYAEETGTPLHGFTQGETPVGHWNEAGHRQGGLRIARWIAEQYRPAGQADAR